VTGLSRSYWDWLSVSFDYRNPGVSRKPAASRRSCLQSAGYDKFLSKFNPSHYLFFIENNSFTCGMN
jgi:hypothetical protein